MKARWLFWSEFGYCLLFFLDSIAVFHIAAAGLPLNDFITHFEPLYYDHEQLRHVHRRTRRSTTETLKLQFFAHNRLFNMKLRRDDSIFAEGVTFESSEGPVEFDISRTFTGQLEDDEYSQIQGMITSEGLFDGVITTVHGSEYYIEPSSRYLLLNQDFHSVIYLASDVKMPITNVTCRSEILHNQLCSFHPVSKFTRHFDRKKWAHTSQTPGEYHIGASATNVVETNSDDNHRALVDSEFNFAVIPDSSHEESNAISALEQEHSFVNLEDSNDAKHVIPNEFQEHIFFHKTKPKEQILLVKTSKSNKLKAEIEEPDAQLHPPQSGVTHRPSSMPYDYYEERRARNEPVPKRHRYQIAESLQQKRAAIDPKKTTCMLYLQADHLFFQRLGSVEACIETMTRHVQKVNNIYKVTDFDQDGRPDNISFMIKRIKVHTLEAMKDPNYRFPGNYGVEKFLELFSEEDYDAFCLAYMFTYRDFEGGTLGLAWTGDLKNAGGVCEKNGHYRGSLKSLNTGIVTLLNYGKHVPPAVSHVTLAHEIGHNFGSPHDPEDNRACTPGGEDGNYIMFARATSGDKRNNNKFSPCSLNNINSVLNTKARGNKGCFTEPQDSICGNEVVEKGEECDCGWEEDCEERCCFPMKANPSKHEPPCKLRPNKTCSPSQGPCCGSECKLQTGTKCRDDNGCRDSSYCDGLGPKCPPSTNKPNKTVCNAEFVCYMGECTGSICIAYGLQSCQCRREMNDPVTKTCELCCKLPGEDQPCVSSFFWNHPPYDIPDMFAKPGTPCDNYNGYCDMFQKCREVDPSGPLATLRKLLLSTESLALLKRWIVEHWWGVLLIAVGFVILLVLIVKVFGKNPNQKMKAVAASGQFPGSNNLAFPSAPQHAITTAVSRTNLPVTTTATSVANGRPFGMAPNGWV